MPPEELRDVCAVALRRRLKARGRGETGEERSARDFFTNLPVIFLMVICTSSAVRLWEPARATHLASNALTMRLAKRFAACSDEESSLIMTFARRTTSVPAPFLP